MDEVSERALDFAIRAFPGRSAVHIVVCAQLFRAFLFGEDTDKLAEGPIKAALGDDQ